MFYSVAVIVIVMVALVAFTGMCSFDRGTPENAPVNKVDEKTFLEIEAQGESFPVRLPAVPDGWTANSARRSAIAGENAPTVGWVIGNDGYLQLSQTAVPLDQAIEGFDGNVRQLDHTYDLAGKQVSVYTSSEKDVRDIRAVDLGDVRLLVTGAATDDDFNALLTATMSATPLPSSVTSAPTT